MAAGPDSKTLDPFAVALGIRVRQERERRKMTKEALGEATSLASRYIWRVEDGRQNITFANLARLSGALGLRLSELLAGVEEIAANPPPRQATKPRGIAARRASRQQSPETDET